MKTATPSAHSEALAAAIRTAIGGVQFYLDEVPSTPVYPYVVLWSDAPISSAESLGDKNELGRFNPAIVVAAQNAATCRQVRDRLEMIYDRDVEVAGRLCELEKISSTQISRDTDIPDRYVAWCRDVLELRSYAT